MTWNKDLSYIVGLITTDGSLSIDGRHIYLTSKDIDQIKTVARILHLKNKIGIKASSYNPNGKYYILQFGNVKLYRFLLEIGLTPNKTKTLGALEIPRYYFADFLRGHLDGDGFTFSYWDKRWKNSFMLYTGFTSASKNHLEWIHGEVKRLYNLQGTIKSSGKSAFQLLYAKNGSLKLLKKLYYSEDIPCLQRKRFKIREALDIIGKRPGVGMVDKHA